MKKVAQKQDRPKAMSQASRSRGCSMKRRRFCSAWKGAMAAAGPAFTLSESRKCQNSASKTAAEAITSSCGAQGPYCT
jgi:hypothetical protein